MKDGQRHKSSTRGCIFEPCSDIQCYTPFVWEKSIMKNLLELIEDYKSINKANLDSCLNYYKSLPLEEAIRKAAFAIGPEGKKCRHQRRIPNETLREAANILVNAKDKMDSCSSFEDLISLVEKETKEVKGFGELAIYDTSLRISAKRDIYPGKVYIHAGTRAGCKALELDCKAKTLPVHAFPEPIKTLHPYEIEDFLCIYKGSF